MVVLRSQFILILNPSNCYATGLGRNWVTVQCAMTGTTEIDAFAACPQGDSLTRGLLFFLGVFPDLQAKLLRVLQEGEFERVGGTGTARLMSGSSPPPTATSHAAPATAASAPTLDFRIKKLAGEFGVRVETA